MPMTAERLTELLEKARKKNWKALESAWLETVEDPVTDPKFYAHLGQMLAKYKQIKRLGEMAQVAVMQLNDEERHMEATRILRNVLRIAPNLEDLHAPLLRALRGAYGDRPHLEKCILASGLTTPSELGQALRLFEQMMVTTEESVFRHKSWGVGVVSEQDLENRTVVIDFPDRQGQRFSFAGIQQYLERIPPTHIEAQATHDPEGLRERLQSDPVGIVHQVLEHHGGKMRQSDLKATLMGSVFTASQWSRWWTTAKDRLRMDPMLDVGLGATGVIALRDEARSTSRDLLERLEKAQTFHLRQQAVREVLRFLRSGAIEPADLQPLSDLLRRGREQAETPSEALTWAYLAEDLANALPEEIPVWRPEMKSLLAEMGGDADLIRGLPLTDHQMRALTQQRMANPEHFGELCVALIDEVTMTISKWMMRELMEDEALHRAAEDSLEQLLHDPSAHPDTYLWAMRQVLGGPWAHLSVANDAPHLLARAIDFLEDLQRQIDREAPNTPALRGMATRIRNTLEEDRHELVVHTMRDLNAEQARPLFAKMMGMSALSDAWKEAVKVSLRGVRGDLEDTSQAVADMLFVTAAKIREKQSDLQHIRTVEIPANSRDIEVAREHGDLSENAEYKAAKERQVLLHRRAEELDDLLSRALPIDPSSVTGETVVPGTRVALRNAETGEEETYTILGLWDADPNLGIISHQSPFASQILTRRAGETVTIKLPSGETPTYEILQIEVA
jgi:transcription elongation factor GreA